MISKALLVLLSLALAQPGCARALHVRVRVAHPFAAATDGPVAVVIRIGDTRSPAGLAWSGGEGPTPRSTRAGVPNIVERRYLEEEALLRRADANEVIFDLRLAAEWEELARLGDFEIRLEDDRGAHWAPAKIASARMRSRSLETTYQTWKAAQRVQTQDGLWTSWVPENQPVREQIFFGGGTVHFRAAELVRPDTRALTLTLRCRARTLRFTWEFDALKITSLFSSRSF